MACGGTRVCYTAFPIQAAFEFRRGLVALELGVFHMGPRDSNHRFGCRVTGPELLK